MSDTPTPRTEAEAFWSEHGGMVVSAKAFAQLERELYEAHKERDDAFTMLRVYKLGCEEQKREIELLNNRLMRYADPVASVIVTPAA